MKYDPLGNPYIDDGISDILRKHLPIVSELATEGQKGKQDMEKTELLNEWVKALAQKMKTADFSEEQKTAVLEVLGSVFEVGRQSGIDEEKLRIQLEKLGKPYLGPLGPETE